MASLSSAIRTLRPVEAGLVCAPAPVGWLWAGGDSANPIPGTAVLLGSWLVALAAFAWNDRADAALGVARHHRRASVRALDGDVGTQRLLEAAGWTAAFAGLACWWWAGPVPFGAAVIVATSAWLYSNPFIFGKGRPIAASGLHLLGGSANGFAGVAVTGDWLAGAVWGAAFGALFTAAHAVHEVTGRDEDRAAQVATTASKRPFGAAARLARGVLLGSLVIPLAGGLALSGAAGTALAAAAAWTLGWTFALSIPAVLDRAAWSRFQRRCRAVVATGAAVGFAFLAHSAREEAPQDDLDRALACLERHQRDDGTWPTYVRWQPGGDWSEVHSVFTTAEVLSALALLPSQARVEALAAPALDALEADRNDDGTWSFYGRADRIDERPDRAWDITADSDDTARAALALRAWNRHVPPRTYDALAEVVVSDGVVRTWFAPPHRQKLTDTNRPDPVVAAAVARALEGTGHGDEVARIRAHLADVQARGELSETTYYVGGARIRHEIDLALGTASPGDPVFGWPAGEPDEGGCWPLQPTFHGAAEAGRPAYGSVGEPTAWGAVSYTVERR